MTVETKPDNATDHVTVLRSRNGKACAKTFIRRASKDKGRIDVVPYGREWAWDPETYPVSDLATLAALLEDLRSHTDAIVICGDLTEHAGKGMLRRQEGAEPTIKLARRQWIAIDVDGAEIPGDTPHQQLRRLWRRLLPEPLRGVSCWYQFTSSQGLKPGLNVRLWFWLDTPALTSELRLYFREHSKPLPIDTSIFTPVQPIYVADPIFENMEPSVPPDQRTGILRGKTDEVVVAAMGLSVYTRAAESRHAAEVVIERKDVEPNETQIARRINELLDQSTDGARHYHALGAACELYALGAETHVIAGVVDEMIRRQGREPQVGEAAGIIKHAVKKDREGSLKTENPPVSKLLDDDDDTDLFDDIDDTEVDGLEKMMMQYDALRNDFHNARVFVEHKFGEGNYIRWHNQDWIYNGKCWEALEDSETLMAMLAQDSGSTFSTTKLASITKRVRAHYQQPNLDMPGWISAGRGTDSHAIVMNNGLVFVDDAILSPKGALQPHSRDYFNCIQLDYDYDPDATCPVFERCVEEWFPGDPASRRELQKMFGYLLIPDNRFERFFVLTDQHAGRTGKGTVCTVLRWLLGERNIASVSLQGLGKDFGLHQLVGKTVAFIDEANVQRERDIPLLAVDRLKMISGNDRVEVEQKMRDAYSHQLTSRFVLSANTMPNLSDPSGALLKRMVLLRFGQTFTGKENRELKRKTGPLFAERAGILNWAIRGLEMLMYEDGEFHEAEAGAQMKEAFTRRSAPLRAFIDECLEQVRPEEEGASMNREDLFEIYQAWMADQGITHGLPKDRLLHDVAGFCPGSMLQRTRMPNGRRQSALYGVKPSAEGLSLIHEFDEEDTLIDDL